MYCGKCGTKNPEDCYCSQLLHNEQENIRIDCHNRRTYGIMRSMAACRHVIMPTDIISRCFRLRSDSHQGKSYAALQVCKIFERL